MFCLPQFPSKTLHSFIITFVLSWSNNSFGGLFATLGTANLKPIMTGLETNHHQEDKFTFILNNTRIRLNICWLCKTLVQIKVFYWKGLFASAYITCKLKTKYICELNYYNFIGNSCLYLCGDTFLPTRPTSTHGVRQGHNIWYCDPFT